MIDSALAKLVLFEKLLEEISFYAPEYDQDKFVVTKEYVKNIFKDEEEDFKKDTGRFIL